MNTMNTTIEISDGWGLWKVRVTAEPPQIGPTRISFHVEGDHGRGSCFGDLSPGQARALAALLVEAAEEIELEKESRQP